MKGDDPKRGWILGCGGCNASFHVQNCALIRVGDTCEHCADWESELPPGFSLDGLVGAELGWCGCANPERVDELMLAFLSSAPSPGEGVIPLPDAAERDAWLLIAYIADDLGWTEHGGSVYGSWLTEAGKIARANLQAAVAED